MTYIDKAIQQLGGAGNVTPAANKQLQTSIHDVIMSGGGWAGLVAPKYNSPSSSYSHNYGSKMGPGAFSPNPSGTARSALQMYKPGSMVGGNNNPIINSAEVKALTGTSFSGADLALINQQVGGMLNNAKTIYAGVGGNVTTRSLKFAVGGCKKSKRASKS
jgi:hypothetical protein